MTHISNIKEALTRMLSSDTPSVISLSGKWGVGKSFFWYEYIKNKETHKLFACKKYSYVSLFGIENMEALKQAIFEHTVPIEEAGEKLTFKRFWNNLQDSVSGELGNRWRNIISMLKDAPVAKQFAPAAYKALYLTMQDTLICLDDLERKGENLRIQDVLGLVSELKEQRNCRIVLISNTDELKDGDDFNRFREKVVDYDYQFERTPEEVFAIGFPEKHELKDLYKQKIKILGLRNIRVIQKIAHFDSMLKEICKPFHKSVYEQAAASIPMLVSLHYATDLENMPSRKHLEGSYLLEIAGDRAPSEQENKLNLLLDEYGWTQFDELDKDLENMIVRGYPNTELLEVLFRQRDNQHRHGVRQNAIRDLWRRYRCRLVDDEKALIDQMLSTYEKHMEVVGPSDINSLVWLLRKLAKNSEADQIIDLFLDKRVDLIKSNDIDDLTIHINNIDAKLLDGIQKLSDADEDKRPLLEVLEMLATSDSWGGRDENYLDGVTEVEFFDLFNSINSRYTARIIRLLIRYSGMSEDEALGRAGRQAKHALERLAGTSPMVKVKLESLGINPNNN